MKVLLLRQCANAIFVGLRESQVECTNCRSRLWAVSSSLAQPRQQAVEAFCEARPNDEHRERERQDLQKAVKATGKGHQDKVKPILTTEDMEDMKRVKCLGKER